MAVTVTALSLVAWKEFDYLSTLKDDESVRWTIFWTAVAFLLPYVTFWFEREINVPGEKDGERTKTKRKLKALALAAFRLGVSKFLPIPDLI